MEKRMLPVSGKTCTVWKDPDARAMLIQLTGDHEADSLEAEMEEIRKRTAGIPYSFVSIPVQDWNQELSPWPAPPVFGNEGFGDGAKATLRLIREEVLPALKADGCWKAGMPLLLGGYSLAGLCALWAGYQTDIFTGILAASPSVWFPEWDSYITDHRIKSRYLYLSLGDKEERTRNRTMARVAERIERQRELAERDFMDIGPGAEKRVKLEWNPGNHFRETEIRMAKGFAWLIIQQE